MSTRCNVKVVDRYNSLWFYRHSDGYPSGALPTLRQFMQWVSEGKVRDNVEQASGWLIIIGHREYAEGGLTVAMPDESDSMMGWKVGAYEPAVGEHGDIEYLYELDLEKKIIQVYEVGWPGSGEFEPHTYNLIGEISEFDKESQLENEED